MIKLNNKGMTAIEVLVTFVLIAIVVVGLYDGIVALKEKETISSAQLSIDTYKNLITKDLQDDFIKKGLVSAKISALTGSDKGYLVNFVFKDNSRKTLKVIQQFGCTATDLEEAQDICLNRGIGINDSDKFSISYGPDGNLVEYPLPDLGHEVIPGLGSGGADHTVYSLKINEVNISSKDRVFSLHITLSHPDLGSDYSIDIVTPLNYP